MRHLFKPRMTLRYPDQKLDLQGPGYHFDPEDGRRAGRASREGTCCEDKCTGCQLCAIACDGVAVAIEMQEVKLDGRRTRRTSGPPWTTEGASSAGSASTPVLSTLW